jgi:peptide chain release factor 2
MGELNKRLEDLKTKLKIEDKKKRIDEITRISSDPLFWQDSEKSSKAMKELTSLSKQVKMTEELEKLLMENKVEQAESEIKDLEFELYFSGIHDSKGAIISLHAGQGGTEAMDWTEMLMRMYMRFCEGMNWKYEVVEEVKGDEAGVKSITITVSEYLAYGYLKSEAGVHRLVRQSPFNADKLRQTSFSLVEVLPIFDDNDTIEIRDEDLEWDVNKVATAVRLKHKPTGIIVQCQQERYQGQNRENALKILKGKLWQMMQQEKIKNISELKGVFKTASWGNQIRSYVLHPYHMVKDLRTGYEVSDTRSVLDGKINSFIFEYLKKYTSIV